MGPEEVKQKYAIPSTESVIDLLALMGDSADNFPGCPGVGEKTAVKLINEFGTVEELIKRTSELKGALQKKVEEHIDDIRLSKFLATIKTDVPIELDMEQLKVSAPDESALAKLLEELELKSLASKILKKPETKIKPVNGQLDLFAEFAPVGSVDAKFSSFETLKTVSHNYKLIDNEEEMRLIYDFFRTKSFLVLDTETTSTSPIEAEKLRSEERRVWK